MCGQPFPIFSAKEEILGKSAGAGCVCFFFAGTPRLGNRMAGLVGQLCTADCLFGGHCRRDSDYCGQPHQLGALCDVSSAAGAAGVCAADSLFDWCGQSALGSVYSGFAGGCEFGYAGGLWRPQY